MKEEWKTIEILDGVGSHKVSNLGRVKSIDRFVVGKGGCRVWRLGRVLKPQLSAKYLQVEIRGLKHTVHRLVAKAFVPGDFTLTVNHKDTNKLNNCSVNLEWLTLGDNIRHAAKRGLYRGKFNGNLGGDASQNKKLNSRKVRAIRVWRSQGYYLKTIAQEYGVTVQCIHNLCSGKSWTNVK